MNFAALLVAGMMAMVGAAPQPGVVGLGQETVKIMPDKMTMTVNLTASDKQFDKALAAIQKKAGDITKALKALKTAPADVKTEGPTRGVTPGNSREEMVRQQIMQAMGRHAAAPKEKGKVTLSAKVNAEWKLTATDAVALLKQTDAIEQGVRTALPKPAPPKTADLSEEQQEEALSGMNNPDQNQPTPGTPTFTFSATLPADKLLAARKQAFKKAVADAKSLAEAGGFTVGRVKNVSGSVTPEQSEEAYYARTLPWFTRTADTEASSNQAHELAFNVSMEVSFGFTGP